MSGFGAASSAMLVRLGGGSRSGYECVIGLMRCFRSADILPPQIVNRLLFADGLQGFGVNAAQQVNFFRFQRAALV